ncbi:hypothetical protein Vadar_013465 [Vaccinium darrowii]|uniref:Uncharacterized protein n=1 Tax=Vaccinium darrowii TaxID=229202 RepID=A0ACB7YDX8_9ERIC|nr:hypothetical protein Vadar_013465 [Vaccinium darrowii]
MLAQNKIQLLRRNKFTRAEAALRGELGSRPDLNGLIEKLTIEDKNCECRTGRNGSESKWENSASIGARNKMTESIGAGGKQFTFSKSLKDNGLDLHSWNFKPGNGPVDLYQTDGSGNENLPEFQVIGRSRLHSAEASDAGKANAKAEEEINVSGEMKTLWVGSSSKPSINESNLAGELKELDQQLDISSVPSRDNFVDNPWSRSNEPANSSAVLRKDCSVKTRTKISEIRAAIKEQVDEVVRALYFGKTKESSEEKDIGSLGFPLASENQKEELPRLPPVKLKSEDKPLSIHWDEKVDHDEPGSKITAADNAFLIGSYLDVPVGQEISSAGSQDGEDDWRRC